jgi:hypothetical protein
MTQAGAKGRQAFLGADHLLDLALARSLVGEAQRLGRRLDHASDYWEDHVREEILDRGAVSLECLGSTTWGFSLVETLSARWTPCGRTAGRRSRADPLCHFVRSQVLV